MGKFIRAAVLVALLSTLVAIAPAFAAEIFVVGQGSIQIDGSGWYAGYVITGSGDYTLNISINGPEDSFPYTNIAVIALVSDDAEAGGLQSLVIDGVPIVGFQTGIPPGYGPPFGGPFSEPDYYGYNNSYVIPSLSFAEAHKPENAFELPVTVQFSNTATDSSKVMFLCYGFDASGAGVKTPFSGGTMFMIPELLSTLMGMGAFGAAFGLYWFRKTRKIKK